MQSPWDTTAGLPVEPLDNELVSRAQSGEREAVVALYRRYVREIHGFALHQTGCTEDAEDITSEVFLSMVRALRGFRGRSSFRTWLYTIARNQVRDHWRRNGRKRTVPLDDSLSGADPEPAMARADVSSLGASVLAQLPDNYRTVIELRVMSDRSVRDTATEMSTTEGNVKVMLHRALRRAAQVAETIGDQP